MTEVLVWVLVLVWLGCPLNQALGAQTFGIESDAVMEMETSETVFIEYRIFTADSTGSDHLLYRNDGTTTLEEEHKHYQRVEQGEITTYTGARARPPPLLPPLLLLLRLLVLLVLLVLVLLQQRSC